MQPLVNFQLVTNEISVRNHHLPNGQFNISPRITRNITRDDETHATVEIVLEIINSKEAPFPIDLRVRLSGIFDISAFPAEEVDDFLKIQAVQILFPYVRTMVSSITASALMPPIVLPVIDVRTLFPEEKT